MCLEFSCQFANAFRFRDEMNGTQYSTVAGFFTQCRKVVHNIFHAYVFQIFFAEELRNGFHFYRNSCIFTVECGVVFTSWSNKEIVFLILII